MLIARGVLGAILLFLGRELNFVFSGGFAFLIGSRVVPLLPATWPAWGDTAFLVTVTLIAAAVPLINERAGYVLSGVLAGGYFLADYFIPGFIAIPVLPFLVGGVLGGAIMGIFTEWALMIASSLIGSFFVMDLFRMDPTAKTLVSGGLFLFGALAQVILRRMQQR